MGRMSQAQVSLFRQMAKHYAREFGRERKRPRSWGYWFWMRAARDAQNKLEQP